MFSSSSPENERFNAWFDETHVRIISDEELPDHDSFDDKGED